MFLADFIDWNSVDWKFIIGDIVIPIFTFVIGFGAGGAHERRKSKSKIKGNNNNVIQNVNIGYSKEK